MHVSGPFCFVCVCVCVLIKFQIEVEKGETNGEHNIFNTLLFFFFSAI